MTDYVKTTIFSTLIGQDSIPTVFDTEFDNIATSVATKADLASPNFTGTITIPSLGAVVSHTGNINQTSPVRSNEVYMHTFPTGTKMAFIQATAPIGWTQDVTHNDAVFRIVNTAGGGTGGTGSIITGAVMPTVTDGHQLTVAEMPSHNHDVGFTQYSQTNYMPGAPMTTAATRLTSNTGGDQPHSHTITGTDWLPKYVETIICTKD